MIQKSPGVQKGRASGAKLHTTALLFLFFSLDSYAADHAETLCPSTCRCFLLGDGTVAADCLLGNHTDYQAIGALPGDTTDLTCTVTGKFNETLLQLNALGQLTKLLIRPQKIVTYSVAALNGTISSIYRSDLLQNQTRLKSLGINIFMWGMTPYLFNPAPYLELLDLSHSFLYSDKSFISVLQNMTLDGHRLQTINLSGMQSQSGIMPAVPILLRDHIYINIQKYPIKTLELLDNDVVELQAGLTKYLPQAEVLRIGSKHRLYRFDKSGCFNIDILLHPILRELFISYPPFPQSYQFKPKRSELKIASMVKCFLDALVLEKGNIPCAVAECACASELHIPCDRIRNVTISEVLDLTSRCYGKIRIPLGPRLERLSFLNSFGLISTFYDNVVKICISPKKQPEVF